MNDVFVGHDIRSTVTGAMDCVSVIECVLQCIILEYSSYGQTQDLEFYYRRGSLPAYLCGREKKNVRPTVAPSLPEGEFMNALVIINIFHVDEKSSLRFSVMSH